MKTVQFVKKEWFIMLITILPIIILGFNRDQLPETLNAENLPIPRLYELYFLTGLNIVLYPLILIFPAFFFAGKSIRSEGRILMVTRTLTHLTFSVFTLTILFSLIGNNFAPWQILTAMILCFILAMGNYFGNLRQNHFIGIRTPWTLANEQVWNLTHRFSAKLLVSSALLGLILLAVNPFELPKMQVIYLCFSPVVLALLISVIYSYHIHKYSNPSKEM
jgi:uncharacterized membrane protein